MGKIQTAISNPKKAIQFIKLYFTEYLLLIRHNGILSIILLIDSILPTKMYNRILKNRSDKNDTIQINILGNKMDVSRHDPGISRDLLVYGTREEISASVFRAHLSELVKRKENPIIIEAGANIGYYLLQEASILSSQEKDGHIHAFEPSPENVKLLKRNIGLNNYQDLVTIRQGAVGSASGTAELAIAEHSNFHRIAKESSVHSGKKSE